MRKIPGLPFSLDWQKRRWAAHLGYTRSASMNHRETINSKNMLAHHGRPSWWKHYVGALGEIIFSLYSGLKVDDKTIGRGDDGSDFPGGIQVKSVASSDCPCLPRLMVLKKLWERKPAKVYVLIYIDEADETAYILGAITSERFNRIKRLDEWGQGPTYYVNACELDPIEAHAAYFLGVLESLPAAGPGLRAMSERAVCGSVQRERSLPAIPGAPVGQRRRV